MIRKGMTMRRIILLMMMCIGIAEVPASATNLNKMGQPVVCHVCDQGARQLYVCPTCENISCAACCSGEFCPFCVPQKSECFICLQHVDHVEACTCGYQACSDCFATVGDACPACDTGLHRSMGHVQNNADEVQQYNSVQQTSACITCPICYEDEVAPSKQVAYQCCNTSVCYDCWQRLSQPEDFEQDFASTHEGIVVHEQQIYQRSARCPFCMGE